MISRLLFWFNIKLTVHRRTFFVLEWTFSFRATEVDLYFIAFHWTDSDHHTNHWISITAPDGPAVKQWSTELENRILKALGNRGNLLTLKSVNIRNWTPDNGFQLNLVNIGGEKLEWIEDLLFPLFEAINLLDRLRRTTRDDFQGLLKKSPFSDSAREMSNNTMSILISLYRHHPRLQIEL